MISLPLRWRDTDQLGHVYHGVVVTLLDEARSRWMTQIGLKDVPSYVVARIEVNYRSEIVYDDKAIDIEINLVRVGNSSITTAERVITSRGVSAESSCTFVHWDADARTSKPIADADRQILLSYTAEPATS